MSGDIDVPEIPQLDPRFRFRPFPPGDPGPEIFHLLRELRDPAVVKDAVRVVLDHQIAVAKLQRQIEGKRVDALTKLRDTVAKG